MHLLKFYGLRNSLKCTCLQSPLTASVAGKGGWEGGKQDSSLVPFQTPKLSALKYMQSDTSSDYSVAVHGTPFLITTAPI